MKNATRRSFIEICSFATIALTSNVLFARSLSNPTHLPQIPGLTTWAHDGTRSALESNLKNFFGNSTGKYIDLRLIEKSQNQRQSLNRQFLTVFDGVPGPLVNLADSNKLVLASMPGDSGQVAMVVTSGDSNTIVATALLHHFCGRLNDGSYRGIGTNCDIQPTLTIFYSGRVTSNQVLNKELIDWTTSYLKSQRLNSGSKGAGIKLKIQVRHLVDAQA